MTKFWRVNVEVSIRMYVIYTCIPRKQPHTLKSWITLLKCPWVLTWDNTVLIDTTDLYRIQIALLPCAHAQGVNQSFCQIVRSQDVGMWANCKYDQTVKCHKKSGLTLFQIDDTGPTKSSKTLPKWNFKLSNLYTLDFHLIYFPDIPRMSWKTSVRVPTRWCQNRPFCHLL